MSKSTLHEVQQALLKLLSDNIDEPLTIRELQDRLGVSSTSVVAHHLTQLERKGHVKRNPSDSRDYQILRDGPEKQVAYLNLYGLAYCGPEGSILDDAPLERIPISTRLLYFPANEGFLVRAKGDSMLPRIAEGDLVITRKATDAESGSIVVCVNNEEALIKKVHKEPTGPILVSLNSKYPPFLAAEDFRIVGKVMGFIGYASTGS